MANKVYSNILDLQNGGYPVDITGSPEQGFYHKGILLQNATYTEHLIIDELYELRSWVVAVTSSCGTIKGISFLCM